MGMGLFLEPLTVVMLLFSGTWINRAHEPQSSSDIDTYLENTDSPRIDSFDLDYDIEATPKPLLFDTHRWRSVRFMRWTMTVVTPNTVCFRHTFVSRLLHILPFLVECWYWVLIYWTYEIGRAMTAFTLHETTVVVARENALKLVALEQSLGVFWEVEIQRFYMARPVLMLWLNRLYSFIHIPGSIAFLVWLYYYTTINRRNRGGELGLTLYQTRRRTLAASNLLAFVVFSLWPCMPPRLLGDEAVGDKRGRALGFVDTVHSDWFGGGTSSSVWTTNRFCNQYAAMPSLHFGYSLLIGLTIMIIPLRESSLEWVPLFGSRRTFSAWLPRPSWRRVLCIAVGIAYPSAILIAILSTANHFILDAAAGAVVVSLAWGMNGLLLNLLPIEDCMLAMLHIHKPNV